MTKFGIGDIVRYSDGVSALFRITHIENIGNENERYYGSHCLGGYHSASPKECSAPSIDDYKFVVSQYVKYFERHEKDCHQQDDTKSVLQPWVKELPMMQQSVLITACRGPDGLRKNHVSKLLIRWLRRCFLKCSFGGFVLDNPYDTRGGSFTGPSVNPINFDHDKWESELNNVLKDYLRHVDEMPHHFQLHFMHAAEILGYKHPDDRIRNWWRHCYRCIVKDAHLLEESETMMDIRLSDNEHNWRTSEVVTAKHP